MSVIMPVFTRRHHNAIAKEIREIYPIDLTPDIARYADIRRDNLERRSILTVLAINLAKRFKEDNPNFDPLKFLDACSPDVDSYPLSELWED